MTAPGDFRASDAERSEVVDRLSRHGADGRLDPAEFEARLQQAMGAKTRGDLEGLFDDLPPLPGERLPRRRRSHLVLSALVVLVVVVSLASASGPFWPGFRAPWLLVAVLGFWLWRRSERHHRRDAGSSAAARFDR